MEDHFDGRLRNLEVEVARINERLTGVQENMAGMEKNMATKHDLSNLSKEMKIWILSAALVVVITGGDIPRTVIDAFF